MSGDSVVLKSRDSVSPFKAAQRDHRRRYATLHFARETRKVARLTMKFSHTEENRDGRHLDVLTDEEDGLRIIVSRLGAELISMARINEAGEWIGFLYRDNDVTAPPQGWANHATVMGYYLHRLKNGSSLYRGHEIKGGTHGFLRAKTWHLAGSSTKESGASLKYQITPEIFPNRISAEGQCGSHLSDWR